LRSYCEDREKPITPGLINDWQTGNGFLLSHWQRAMLHAMDIKYRVTLSEEVASNAERKSQSDAVAANGVKKGKR